MAARSKSRSRGAEGSWELLNEFRWVAISITDVEISAGRCAYCRTEDHFTARDRNLDCPIAKLGNLADRATAALTAHARAARRRSIVAAELVANPET